MGVGQRGVEGALEAVDQLLGRLHVLLESGTAAETGGVFADEAAVGLARLAADERAAGRSLRIELRSGVLWTGAHERVRVGMSTFAAYTHLVSWMASRRFASIEVRGIRDTAGGVDLEATRRGLRTASSLDSIDPEDFRPLGLECERFGVLALPELDETPGIAADGGGAFGPQGRTRPNRVSRLGAVYLSQPLVDAAVEMGAVDLRIAKGVVQGVVDRLHAERALLPALTRLQTAGRPMIRHAASVCLFSVLLGRRLGLGEELLLALGAGGLVHDLGRLDADQEDAPGDDEGHARAGFLALVRSGMRTEIEMRAAAMVLEHHAALAEDRGGLGDPDGPRLLPAILGVADRFDHASHVGGRFTPDAGLWELRRDAEDGGGRRLPQELVAELVPALAQAASR